MEDERIAQALMAQGILDETELAAAREEAEQSGISLVQALLKLGYVDANTIARIVETIEAQQGSEAGDESAEALELPDVEVPEAAEAAPQAASSVLSQYQVDHEALRAIPRAKADEYCVLPINMSQDRILLAMADVNDIVAIDAVRAQTHRQVEPIEVDEEELRKAIDQYYTTVARAQAASTEGATDLGASVSGGELVSGVDVELLKMLDQGHVVQIVETLVSDAVKMRASDIHIEPRGEGVQVRYRVDGRLMNYTTLPPDMLAPVLSRIKILAGEDISETRLPQGGRFATVVDERPIDLRVSTLPTYWGEKAVMRILDKSRIFVALTQLGFSPEMQQTFEDLVNRPQGMILVTGPTGSGKSTTLYAALHTINDETKNITTVEDPIEYEVQGLNQVQIHPVIGLDFAECLRHILRQDPDVILVGEIRDLETAQMAFRASLTGHLVLSTLHTNDAPSATTRLVDMGVPPYLIASSVTGVLAQRLARRICTHCRTKTEPTAQELKSLGLKPEQAQKINFYRGRGCQQCRNTGYLGRVALYELMLMNDQLREALTAGANASQLRQIAIKTKMRTLKYDGLLKIHQGITTAAEVMGVMFSPEDF